MSWIDRLPRDVAALLAGGEPHWSAAGESGGAVARLRRAGAPDLFLKHGTGRVADDIADEFIRLRWLQDRLPAPTIAGFVAEQDGAWLVTTALPGSTGDAWLARDPDALPRVIDGFAAFLRRMHALPVEDCPFDAGASVRLAAARRNVAAGLVDAADFDAQHAGWTPEAVLAKADGLRPPATPRCVTHGDYSLGNVLLDAAGVVTGCIDLGRLGIAHPYQDIGILWQNLGQHGAAAQARLLSAYGIERCDERALMFHRCLDELF